jgi:hypothetical protein
MKSLSCRDPKMEAYYGEVWRLEDKFHGLELNHIARRYNEVADELAKITSSRTMVPLEVFMRDLHQPSINIMANGGVDGPSLDPPPEAEAPSIGAKAMPMEGSAPPANPSLTGVFRTSTISLEGTSPRIRSRLDGLLTGPNPL